jgi:hypothetical protein
VTPSEESKIVENQSFSVAVEHGEDPSADRRRSRGVDLGAVHGVDLGSRWRSRTRGAWSAELGERGAWRSCS